MNAIQLPCQELGELSELITKGTTPTTVGFEFSEIGVPFVRAQNIRDGSVEHRIDSLFINAEAHRALARSRISPGDILISIAGTIGRAGIVPDNSPEMNCNQAVAIVRLKSGLDRRYALHWLQSFDALSQMSQGQVTGTISNLSLGQVSKLKVPLPPLPEQRRIAAILDQADALRAKRREALAKLDEMAQAIFVEMFVSNIGKSEVWPRRSVGSLALAMRTGPFGSQLLHSEFVNEGVAVLGIDNAVSNQFAWGERRFVTERKYRELSRYRVFPNDVIVTIMGTCGRVAIVPDDIPLAISTKHLCSITLDGGQCLPEFLHACLLRHSEVRRQLGAAAKGAVMPGLNMGIIRRVLIPLPPISLQAEFVNRTKGVASIVAWNREALNLLDNLVAALQHRAFSGAL